MIRLVFPLLIIAVIACFLVAGIDFALLSRYSSTAFRFAFAYYTLTFTMVTMWLLFRLRQVMYANDESLIGKVLLKGMVWHFVYSLIILMVYWKAFYQEEVGEVWMALMAYSISFIVYIRAALMVK